MYANIPSVSLKEGSVNPYATQSLNIKDNPSEKLEASPEGNPYLNEKQLEDRISDVIWSPTTWLHQKQLIDDFVIFTVMNELCVEEGVEFIFNIRQCFKNFMIENMPSLEVSHQSPEESNAKIISNTP